MNQEDIKWMRRALERARQGEGFVEPNPMVGCVLVREGRMIGEGCHRRFGGPHAEVEAIRDAERQTDDHTVHPANGATCYVTLEPCSHYGKTPPCVERIMETGIRRVVLAMRDPNPLVDGQGVDRLRSAGIEVTEHVLEEEARHLNAPYLTRIEKKRPWIIAKWAMTADGKLATRTGDSCWISGEASRRLVHRLRSRMDAVLVGIGTAIHDDCSLTVRLADEDFRDETLAKRTPLRIVLDSEASISPSSRLVQTAGMTPVLIVVGPDASEKQMETRLETRLEILQKAGCEIFRLPKRYDINLLLQHLAGRGTTNLLVEGGSRLFGSLFDQCLVDEAHVFMAPKLVGGLAAPTPIAGSGLAEMKHAFKIDSPQTMIVEEDIYLQGRIRYEDPGKQAKQEK